MGRVADVCWGITLLKALTEQEHGESPAAGRWEPARAHVDTAFSACP